MIVRKIKLKSISDPFMFYACTIISFLESRVDTYVENLIPFYQCDTGTKDWLENVWQLEEQKHGMLMRAYVEKTWPDFMWDKGFKQFSSLYIPQCATEKLRRSAGLEALARCVTETQSTMIYRCVASYTIDTDLKSLLLQMSADEVRHFKKFNELHQKYEPEEKNSFFKRARILLNRSNLVINEDIALAFQPLNCCWIKPPKFKPWDYKNFLENTAQVMKQHFPLNDAKQLLFHPLKTNHLTEKIFIEIIAKLVERLFLRVKGPSPFLTTFYVKGS